jgi:hypothetical protein
MVGSELDGVNEAAAGLGSGSSGGRRAMLGLLSRRERWGLTLRGWLVSIAIAGGIVALCVWRIVPFLAVTQPVVCEYLVVEGWLPNYAIQEAAEYFRQHRMKRIITVGGPVRGAVEPAGEDDTYAYTAATALRKLGLAAETDMVPSEVWAKDRTAGTAIALREWLTKKQIKPGALTVVSLGTHARRTRLLYERGFEGTMPIGIIAVRRREYDPACWWRYSEGIKEVVSEGLAYVYARLQF